MKIAIVTAVFAPSSTPRALRATELAKEFGKQGHSVTVFNCTKIVGDEPPAMENVEYIDLNIRTLSNKGVITNIKRNKFTVKIFNWVKNVAFYWTLSTWMVYLRGLKNKFHSNEKYDLLISIGLPFTIHWGISTMFNGHNLANCYVADYGDPFSMGNINIRVAKYFRIIEKRVINKFDYISIPTEKALSTYKWLKPEDKIKIIPQGFNFDNVEIGTYTSNDIPTFAYAGIFYPDIRNPKHLFEFLLSLEFDFRFVIYTTISNSDSYSCILPYISKLKDKLVIKDFVPRKILIKELSLMDFIINMNNLSTNQVPSKLIDYALSRRPIFSCSPNYLDENEFVRFCSGNYEGQEKVDLNRHDIKSIVAQFCNLVKA